MAGFILCFLYEIPSARYSFSLVSDLNATVPRRSGGRRPSVKNYIVNAVT